jgi:hypothetical protein
MALVCLARFFDFGEAAAAQAALESAGIRAFLFDTGLAQTAWHLTTALGGMRLMVSDQQAAEARALLALPTAEEDAAVPIDICPACGGADVARLYSWWSLVPSSLTSMPFLFARMRRRCRTCGHRWRVRADFAERGRP